MKKLHIYARTPNGNYGGCGWVQYLTFYDTEGKVVPVSDISTANTTTTCTFKLRGIKGTINMPYPYSADYNGTTYLLRYIFSTATAGVNSVAVFANNTGKPIAQQGFSITFENEIYGIAGVGLVSTYYKATNFVVSVDGGAYEPFSNSGDYNKVEFSRVDVRCLRKENGDYHFLRPKVKDAI